MKDFDPAEEPRQWKASLERWKAAEARAVAHQNAAQDAVHDRQQAVTSIIAWIAALTPAAAGSRDRGSHLETVIGDLTATNAAIAVATDAIADREQARDIATARLLAGPPTSAPVTLLPVSLHTSWAAGTLRVRIYPDQISLTHHDPALTAAEKAAAHAYWATRGAGHADQAWADLVRRAGPQRAAWVVSATNPADGPAPAGPDRSWTDLSLRAELLPDRFAIVAYAAGQPVDVGAAGAPPHYVTWGNPIGGDPLTIAPWASPDEPGWTTDFGVAEAAGMAVTITVPPAGPAIDQLVAVGLRTATGDLADLLDEQAYTAGVEILPDGLATNNTSQARSGASPARDADIAAELIAGAAPAIPAGGSAGAQLALLLGLSPGLLSRTAGAHAARTELPAAIRLLVGLAASGPVAQAAGPEAAGAWGLVSPGGPAPALRIGPQPYGVLPATVPGRWIPAAGEAGAGAAALLARWAGPHVAPADVDPADPPAVPPPARHVTPGDESALLDLLGESASSLAWSDGTAGYAGLDGLIGPAEGARAAGAYLEVLAAAAPADLPGLALGLPDTLLARIALTAKRSAPASTIAAVDTALRTLGDAARAEGGRVQLADALAGHLDALSHRVDAWITAVAAERLGAQRTPGTPGATAVVGAYGYVSDVAPRTGARSYGHVHAPSLGQAATAAVLRAGYLGQRRTARAAAVRAATNERDQARADLNALGPGGTAADRRAAIAALRRAETALAAERAALAANAPLDAASEASLTLAIDLSSRRVRSARLVLAAVRGGQGLGAVLGYQFERDLADAGLTRYLAAFRKLTRFQTGTVLEQLEDARRQARRNLDAATARLAGLTAVASAAGQAADAAGATLREAQAAQAAADARAAPYLQMQHDLVTVNAWIPQLRADLAAIDRQKPVPHVVRRGVKGPDGRYDVDISDPADDTTTTQWAIQRAAKARELAAAQARAAQLTATLAGAEAGAALDAAAKAHTATGDAQGAADRAADAHTAAATAAARFAANDLADARTAVDSATKAVADQLAQLLSQASASTALTATVDGLALRERYRSARASQPPTWDLATIPFLAALSSTALDPEIVLPAVGGTDYAPLITVLDQLDDLVDAVADLITAEGVHHLVNGNATRSGAALDIAASGTVPDELDVIRTPLTGYDITHRVLVLMPAAPAAAWPAAGGTANAGAAGTADPALAAWVSHLLPDPATVHFTVIRLDPVTGAASEPLTLTADSLGLAALDWVRLSADPAELAARTARVARARWAASLGEAAAAGPVVLGVPQAADPAIATLADLIAAAAAVRAVLTTARALAPADLATAAEDAQPSAAAANAAMTRISAVEALVAAILADLAAAAVPPAAGSTPPDADSVLTTLLAAAALGVAEAVPALDQGTPGLDVLTAQAGAAYTRLAARVAAGPVTAVPDDPATTLARARERAAALCGLALPLLTSVPAPADPSVAGDLGSGAVRIPGADPASVRQWLHDHARVRPACAALITAYDLAQSLGAPAELDVRATHLPSGGETARWAGDSDTPPPAVINAVAVRPAGTDPSRAITGLAVDAWTQTIPGTLIHTGLAFHYDRPTATPPQALLIAVAPDTTAGRQPGTWDLDTLLDTITATIALAGDRARAAELDPAAAVTLHDPP
ncbi:MAG TPA: hypothetical protein VGH88_03695 [Streptosporangiaceae bacterium]